MSENKKTVEELYNAYVYGYPLVALELQKRALTNTVKPTSQRAPINQLIHAANIANSDDKYIVMLNMDTVYSQVYFDLRKEPIYFRKPKTDRYATALILDAYGNSVGILGTGDIGGNEEVNAVLVGPDYKGEIPEGYTRIDVPTNDSWSLIRVILNDENDYDQVKAIQDQFDVRPLSAVNTEYVYPDGTYNKEYDYIPFEKFNSLGIIEFFEIFNSLIGDNKEEIGKDILQAVEKYGVGDGLTFDINAFDEDTANAILELPKRLIKDFEGLNTKGEYQDRIGEWVYPKDNIAHFGTDYLFRANIAWGGIGVNPVSMALYPTATTDEDGEAIHSDNDYVFHFSSEPPVNAFWSLTLYGDDKFQIPNEIGRYGINDRSDIDKNEDGSFDIYVQRNRPSEDKVKNWLPSGERGVWAVLRLYLPKDEILNRKWELPRVEKIKKS